VILVILDLQELLVRQVLLVVLELLVRQVLLVVLVKQELPV
jgi:hypothetical protein